MSKKDQQMTMLTTLVAVTLVLALANVFMNIALLTGGSTGGSPTAAPSQPTAPSQPGEPVDVSADDDAVKGDKDAPVTIIEFSDYQCPFCARWYTDTLPQIQKEYIDTGKAKLVYRDFPLSFHQNAQKAAEAAECAGEQNRYWQMHDKLFENQQALDVASLKQYAIDIGLKANDFNTCLDSGKMAQEVQDDFNAGRAAGVSGTPGFFVNGQLIVGAQPYSVFKQAIDAALAE